MIKRYKRKYNPTTVPKGELVFKNREFIGNVETYTGAISGLNSSNAFAPSPFCINPIGSGAINPGNEEMFPWLSTIASNFQKYRFKYLTFYLKSITSDAIASTGATASTLGQILMAVDYNSSSVLNQIPAAGGTTGTFTYGGAINSENAPYNTIQQMMNSEGAMMCKPSQHMKYVINVTRKDAPYKWYFVDASAIGRQDQATNTTVGDLRLYNIGNLEICTAGVPTTCTAASPAVFTAITTHQLWVEYSVEFDTPIESTKVTQIGHYAFYVDAGSSINSNLFGMGAGTPNVPANLCQFAEDPDDNHPIKLTFSNGNIVTFPNGLTGLYEVEFIITGTAAATSTITVSAVNCYLPVFHKYSLSSADVFSTVADVQIPQQGLIGQTVSAYLHQVYFPSASSAATLTYSVATFPTGNGNRSYTVKQINSR